MKNPNENNKIVQDVIPPKRSIRDIELPSRRESVIKDAPPEKSKEKQIPIRKEIVEKEIVPPKQSVPIYKYDFAEPKKPSKKWLYMGVGFLVLAVVFGVMSFFKSAEIRIAPKQAVKTLNSAFTAQKDGPSGTLGFQIVTVTKSAEKTVEASNEERVDKKARGTIVIYNNYSSASQKLVATTRFETPEGLVFRLIDAITVPGTQVKDGKTVPGSIEATVEADKPGTEHNIGLKDFTIPGLKGDARYTKMYGRSKTAMVGGFSGMQKVVSKATLGAAEKTMEDAIKADIGRDIVSQIPANYVLYSKSLTYEFQPAVQSVPSPESSAPSQGALLKKTGVGRAIIFDRNALSHSIIEKVLPGNSEDLKVSNLDALEFTFQSVAPKDDDTSTLFILGGEVNIIWTFDENKLKSDILGLSKDAAKSVIATYTSIQEAWITTKPFWSRKIPADPAGVTLVNTAQ